MYASLLCVARRQRKFWKSIRIKGEKPISDNSIRFHGPIDSGNLCYAPGSMHVYTCLRTRCIDILIYTISPRKRENTHERLAWATTTIAARETRCRSPSLFSLLSLSALNAYSHSSGRLSLYKTACAHPLRRRASHCQRDVACSTMLQYFDMKCDAKAVIINESRCSFEMNFSSSTA